MRLMWLLLLEYGKYRVFKQPGNTKKIVYLLYFVQINNGTYFFRFRGILPKEVLEIEENYIEHIPGKRN